MHARGRSRRTGGTALLAAFVIAASAAGLAGCGADNSAGERAVTSSAADGVDSELRSFSVVNVVRISKIPRPPVPPRLLDHMRIPERVRRLPVPHEKVPTPAVAAKDRVIEKLTAPHVRGLTAHERREVFRGACIANDLIRVAEADSWDDAATEFITSFGGPAMLHARVVGLAKDMAEARSSADKVEKAVVFGLCEMA